MIVGLINLEPKIVNAALMQISHYHKTRRDIVEWYDPNKHNRYNKLYCSSLFDFTDKSQVPGEAFCGGTGFDLTTKLPFECQYDYSIYPECDFSIVWFSRGCKRKCPWCVVPEKEGAFHLVRRRELNPAGRYVKIMDNDFFANPEWESVISWIGQMPIDIQGIDVRTITEPQCKALNGLRRWRRRQFKIAWDNPLEEKQVMTGIHRLLKHVKAYKIMCYVLIGHSSTLEQNVHRIMELKKLKIDPYVMCVDRKDRHQKLFQRWVNGHAYRNVSWADFRKPTSQG